MNIYIDIYLLFAYIYTVNAYIYDSLYIYRKCIIISLSLYLYISSFFILILCAYKPK